ncbi:glycosyl transferase, group 1 [Dehalobacter sp. DCA]|uniref:glycosyltransferase family 4 protein n=1 Tax=Dehalobacter sp. DCA TaxID=1147129 RepID=UPI00028ABB2B|nr:glycosyltransferase family 4 protein [Dehalobacter sp. DCA]AFV02099.1 glycosyl transferase, group 1 [Dehalobacter sp. DCA]
MNILFLTHVYPYPPDSGGLIFTYNAIKHEYDQGHNVTIITLHKTEIKTPLDQIADVKIVCKNTRNRIFRMFLNMFSRMPYNSSKYKSKLVKTVIKEVLETKNIDVVYIDHLHMAVYGKYIRELMPSIPLILREQNVETTIMQRFYQNQTNPVVKLYAYIQFLKLNAYESKVVEDFDKCFMLTDNDSERIKKMNHRVKNVTIPAGVDIEKYVPKQTLEEEGSILFLGTLNWLPNADGLKWFIDHILDRVKEEIPDIKFYIVGKDPIEQVKRLHNGKNIIVTGYVDDERDYIAKCSVFIVPLRIGGGMRIKILNAMSMAKCIVSTSIGAEGIDIQNRKDIFISDDPGSFATDIIFLMKNKETRETISRNAREKVLTQYSWDAIFKIADSERSKLLEI